MYKIKRGESRQAAGLAGMYKIKRGESRQAAGLAGVYKIKRGEKRQVAGVEATGEHVLTYVYLLLLFSCNSNPITMQGYVWPQTDAEPPSTLINSDSNSTHIGKPFLP